MKRLSLLLFSLIAYTQIYGSHSQLLYRTPFQSSSPERIADFRFPTLTLFKPACYGAYFQAVGYGGHSTSGKKLAKYFLPFNKNNLSVIEGTEFNASTNQPTIICRDIDPSEFNVVTLNNSFKSELCFNPRQRFAGIGFDYLQVFWWDCCGVARWWGEISFAVEKVENNLRFTETICDASCGSIGNCFFSCMTEAFNSPLWNFGKITNCSLKKTGVADLEIKFGYSFVNNLCVSMQGYIGAIVATGNKPCAGFLFEPVVGNNKHNGILWGSDNWINLWSSECWSFNYAVNLTGRYLFRNIQHRSFDLKDKSWSRYMLIYQSAADATAASTGQGDKQVPGINCFTLETRVNPGFEGTMTNAFVSFYKNFNAEIGYNIYVRQSESVKPCSSIDGIALADISGNGTTNPARTINHQYILFGNQFTATNYHPLAKCNLDLDSGRVPAVLSHTVYGNIGYQWDNCFRPVSFDIGGSYEFSHEKAVVNRFIVWGKVIVGF